MRGDTMLIYMIKYNEKVIPWGSIVPCQVEEGKALEAMVFLAQEAFEDVVLWVVVNDAACLAYSQPLD
jgi:hypothetical protein